MIILAMSIGAYPGFAPAVNNVLAPIERLQEIYADIYELENIPIIMQPTYLNQKNPEHPIYYSLTYPTTISFSPKSRRNANKISELKEIQHVLKRYVEQIANTEFNIHDVPLANVPQSIQFDCFHTSQISKEIRDGALIFEEDNTFSKLSIKKQGYNFPDKSPFLRGCVRIAPIIKS